MSISSLGAGSGLDLAGTVSKLMAVEQQPLTTLKTQQTSANSRFSALGTLKSTLASLQAASKKLIPATGQSATSFFATNTATLGDTSLASATVSSEAAAATYKLTNITLAQTAQIRKTGLSTPANDGTLTIQVGSGKSVDIDIKGGSSLTTVASAINKAGAGVRASVVNNGTADYLVVSAINSGASNQIDISTDSIGWESFAYSGNGINSWTEQQRGSDASVDIDGLHVTSSSNTIPSSALNGVTLTLTKESASGTTLTVAADQTSTLTSQLTSFVNAYNSAVTTMKALGKYDAASGSAGPLLGDATLRGAQSQLRSLLLTQNGGTSKYQMLSDIGISVSKQKDGTLEINTEKLKTAATADFSAVANLVTKIGTAFNDRMETLVGTSGNVVAASDSTQRKIDALSKRQTELEDRLAKIQDRYIKQFSALDTQMASMSQTSSYLTQQLANL